jgi:ribonuclease P protein subunit POP4
MPINSRTLPAHELIGLRVRVASTKDPTLAGLEGTVRNETRNTLVIEARGRMLTVPKSGASFLFQLSSGENSTVDGDALRFRPEDRVKKSTPRW